MLPKPFVVAIAGNSGAGKSTLCRKLRELIPDSALFELDMYEEIEGIWPPLSVWSTNNFDPNMANLKPPADDLRQLLAGQPITYPFEQGTVQPASVIIFDTPIGRSHPEFESLIDFLVFVDVPYEVALARRVQRIIDFSESDEAAIKRLRFFIPFYLKFGHLMYIHFNDLVRESADAGASAMQAPHTLAVEVFHLIEKRRS